MKKRNTSVLFPAFFLLIVVFTSPLVSANNTPQWFPDEETAIVYELTHYLTLTNGTDSSDSKFDLFYYNGTIFARATHFQNLTGAWSHYDKESLANSTLVRVHITYDTENSTHLVRSSKVVWDSGESNSSVVELQVIFVEMISAYMAYPFSTEDEYIQINDYPDYTDSFVDYTSNTLGIGEHLGISGELHEYLVLVSIVPDSLIAFGTYGTLSYTNTTYVFDLSGKSRSFAVGIYHIGFPGVYSTYSAYWRFAVVNPEQEGSFFSNLPWNWILSGIAGLELIVVIILAAVSKKRGK